MKSLARAYTDRSILVIGGYLADEVDPDIRLRAAGMLLDRGWGKPNQPAEAKLDGELRITIRKLLTKEEDDNQ
jgi:hypothetical protein